MSYTSFKQAILLLAASEVLLSQKSEAGEPIKVALEPELVTDAQPSSLYAASDRI